MNTECMKALKSDLAKRVRQAARTDAVLRRALANLKSFEFEGKTYTPRIVPKAH